MIQVFTDQYAIASNENISIPYLTHIFHLRLRREVCLHMDGHAYFFVRGWPAYNKVKNYIASRKKIKNRVKVSCLRAVFPPSAELRQTSQKHEGKVNTAMLYNTMQKRFQTSSTSVG